MSITESKTVPCSHCNGTGSITLPPEIATIEAYYFGCQRESGHFWWRPDRLPYGASSHVAQKVGPLIHPKIDSGFCPKRGIQGHAKLTQIDGWTILSFWDNSVDSRPGSSSSFVARGAYDLTTMQAIAREQFPRVWKRYTFTIQIAEE